MSGQVKKKILFVVNIKNYNIFNRKSAIDSILCSILMELSENYEVYVNTSPLTKKVVYNTDSLDTLSESSRIKKMVPEFVKQFLRDLNMLKGNKQLFNEISKLPKPDLIIELMRYGSDLGSELKKHFNVPLIAYFDSPAVEENKFLKGKVSAYYSKIAKSEEKTVIDADKVIVYSEVIKRYWLARSQFIDPKKFEIFQTLDYTRLSFNHKKIFGDVLTIGFVGSFLKWHKVENLLHAYTQLRVNGYKVKLLLVGAGEEFKAIQKEVDESPWKGDITLTGFIDGEKLNEYRNKIDIGVMPGTHWYCMPTKVFEYGASGIVSIVPGTRSIKRMFTGEEVVFLEDSSPEELFSKLEIMLNKRHEMNKLAINLRTKVLTTNSIQQANTFYNNLINNLLEKKTISISKKYKNESRTKDFSIRD